MKIAADECCDSILVAGLREDGHDIWYAKESAQGPAWKRRATCRKSDEFRIFETENLSENRVITKVKKARDHVP